jgi:pimeloyl-ACP methyl ester carboxylesterase
LDAGRALRRPPLIVLGWSFGTDLVLKYARHPGVDAVVLLSPPLRYTTDSELTAWAEPVEPGADPIPMTVLVPELDDYVRPAEALQRFSVVPQARVIGIPACKHLWVGEKYVRNALNAVATAALGTSVDLPEEWGSDPKEAR